MIQSLTEERFRQIVSSGSPVRLNHIVANFNTYLNGFKFVYKNGEETDFQGESSNAEQYWIPDQVNIRTISVFVVKNANFIMQI